MSGDESEGAAGRNRPIIPYKVIKKRCGEEEV